VSWDELKKLSAANLFGIAEAAERAAQPDPWPDYFKQKQTVTKAMMRAVGAVS
jgi:bifunctional non-homologous end joining protein LigD